VARVRRVLDGVKVGHAGTLDPDATGVLVICVGKATKISSFLMEGEKVYVGTGRLGVTTDTQDASGEVVRERPVDVDEEGLRTAAARFVGRIEQVPPMYSAVKVGGKKLYRLARQGVEVERPARPAHVHELVVDEVRVPEFDFTVRCSKGTYVRTLVHDLGEALGCGGHLVRLVRTRQGGLEIDGALGWDDLEGPDAGRRIDEVALPPEEALAFLPRYRVPATAPPLKVGGLVPGTAVGDAERDAGPEPGTDPDGPCRLVVSGGRVGGVGTRGPEGVRVLHLFPPRRAFGRRSRAS
jgi:tRNA pseudouridine55 synthase